MEDDKVDAAMHMELNNIYPTDYNLGSSDEEEEVPNEFTKRFYGFKDNDVPLYAGLRDIKSMLPKDNKQVENFYKAKKCSKEISIPIKKIHACEKHCMLLYDFDASLNHCRWCGTSRYKSCGRKVYNLVLMYMPISDRLQMLYMSEKTTKDMTWHTDHKIADDSMMKLKESYVQLALLIPGRKIPDPNIDVFLRPLIDELKDLYDVGVDTYDAYRRQNFRMKAIPLWTVSDFPAYVMLSEPAPQMALVESPQMVSSVKLPILKIGEYILWSMRMEQYLTNIDSGLGQVIMNGDEPVQTTRDENGVETKDAKSLWAAIKSRLGGNVESKKMQKTVLKQQFENFSVSDTEGLDKAYDRFQKLINLLEVHGATVSNKDTNQKFLQALPSSWNNITLIMRNKEGIDELDIDDLYNNLKVFEADIKDSSGSSSNSQNVAFFFAKDTNSINEVNTTNDVSTIACHSSFGQASSSSYTDDLMFLFFVSKSNSLQLDLEEMNLKWDNNKRTVPVESSDALVVQDNALIVQDELGYDWSYIAQKEPTEFALMAYTSGSDTEKNEVAYEEKIAVLEFEVKDKDQLSESDSEVLLSGFDSRSSDADDNLTNDRFKKGDGYHAVPPPLTRNYMPPLADLSFTGLDDSVYRPTTNKASASISKRKLSVIKTSNISVEMPKVDSVRTSRVIIKDCVTDDEDTLVDTQVNSQTIVKHSFKKIEFTKVRNESVKSNKQADKPKMVTQNSKADKKY
nr:hypothetical protein [Tanacetum cinerariifolium]